MKSWIFIGAIFFATTLSAEHYEVKQGFFKDGSKANKLNSKAIQFYASHPKTAAYFHQGGEVIAKILENYCSETEKLIQLYPQAQATFLAEKRLANIRHFLSHKTPFIKGGLFLFLGIYSLDDYQDAKSWKSLIKIQAEIANHFAARASVKKNCQKYQEGVLEQMERDLMTNIRKFCQKSADPFFHSTLAHYIKECHTREDTLKQFASLRDETVPIPGEVVSEAEEAYTSLNEETWAELKLGVKEYFNRSEALEQFVDITSDAFDIPKPLQERFEEEPSLP